MTTAVITQGIVIVALLILVFTERRTSDKRATAKNEDFTKMVGEIEVRHAAERRELLTRIQHPHLVPQTPGKRREQRPTDTPNLAKVGTISPPKKPE